MNEYMNYCNCRRHLISVRHTGIARTDFFPLYIFDPIMRANYMISEEDLWRDHCAQNLMPVLGNLYQGTLHGFCHQDDNI